MRVNIVASPLGSCFRQREVKDEMDHTNRPRLKRTRRIYCSNFDSLPMHRIQNIPHVKSSTQLEIEKNSKKARKHEVYMKLMKC